MLLGKHKPGQFEKDNMTSNSYSFLNRRNVQTFCLSSADHLKKVHSVEYIQFHELVTDRMEMEVDSLLFRNMCHLGS